MPRIFLNLAYVLVMFSVSFAPVSAKRYNILVNAEADEEYTERTKDLAYQTYHFVKGQFFGGGTRDKGLETAEFESLAESLAVVLKKRDFYPEPDQMKGDLMIMISWGRTALDADYGELMGVQSFDETLSAADRDMMGSGPPPEAGSVQSLGEMAARANIGQSQYFGGGVETAKAKNIMLLGLEDDLEPEFDTMIQSDSLWDVLEEERYFVILNAFDYQHLLEHKELKQVWRVRYNTKAIGIGFRTAFDSMNQAVSGVIGMNLDKITTVKGDTNGSVRMGEVEVISTGEEAK